MARIALIPKASVTAYIPTEMRQRLVKMSEVTGQSLSQIMTRALSELGV